jgi:sulfoxide reductase heme-binding subunit YedZ
MLLLGALPLAELALRAAGPGLGANPIETVTHVNGRWSLRLLLLTLAVTPARRLLGWSALAPLRRSAGLAAFFAACLHLLTFVALDHAFDFAALLEDIRDRRYVTAGLAGFVCLVPLALTSNRAAMRRLGRRWQTLHRLAYVAAACGVAHYLWLVKADLRAPLLYAGLLVALLAARRVPRRRRLSSPAPPGPPPPRSEAPPAPGASSAARAATGRSDPPRSGR